MNGDQTTSVHGSLGDKRLAFRSWRLPIAFSASSWPWERWLVIAAMAIYAAISFYHLGRPSLGSDEGRFGISALNILHDPRQLALVSEQPMGGVGTKPFLYPLMLALSILALGRTAFALRCVNAIGLIIAALCLGKVAQKLTQDRFVAALTVCFFLLDPWTITYARVAIPDTCVVIWGCVGLLAAVLFFETRRYRWPLLAGAALGCGFLSKMWLVFPFVVGCGVLILATYPSLRKKVLLAGAAASLGFVLVASSHLLLALWLAPGSVRQWLHIYFGFSLGSRWTGPGFDPSMWYHPWWFYLLAFFKAVFFGLPLLVLGAISLARRRDVRTAAVLAALLLPLPVLSIFLVKQTSYLYAICPALAFLMALGAADWLGRVNRTDILVAVGVSLIAAIAVGEGRLLPTAAIVAVLALYAAYAIAVLVPRDSRRLAVGACLMLALITALAADGRVLETSLAHRTYYREVAAYFRSAAANRPVHEVSFIAPEFPAFEFYLFRRGEYWKTWYVQAPAAQIARGCQSGSLIFFVMDPDKKLYGGAPTRAQLRALRGCTTNVTTRIESHIHHTIPLSVLAASRG